MPVPRRYIEPGADGTLDSVVAGDDLELRGLIDPGRDGVINSTVHANDIVRTRTEIGAGPDNILQSVPLAGSDERIHHTFIAPGSDGICQTAGGNGDNQGDIEVGDSINFSHESSGENLIKLNLDPATSVDEWGHILGTLADVGVPPCQ